MRLEKASAKAVKYAVMNWHYSKSVPGYSVAYSVFENNKFCGVVTYSLGANKNIGSPFGLKQGQIAELTRVALNGNQGTTSKVVSISLKLIKKECPLLRLIVSYADKGQNHLGVLYQASNWYYVGELKSSGIEIKALGKWMHKRSFDSLIKKTENPMY